jgi:hypothetical protein
MRGQDGEDGCAWFGSGLPLPHFFLVWGCLAQNSASKYGAIRTDPPTATRMMYSHTHARPASTAMEWCCFTFSAPSSWVTPQECGRRRQPPARSHLARRHLEFRPPTHGTNESELDPYRYTTRHGAGTKTKTKLPSLHSYHLLILFYIKVL